MKELSEKNSDMRRSGEEPSPGESECIRENSEDTPTGEKEWSEAGLESATRSRMAGNCPGFMERVVNSLNSSKVPWNEVLAYYLRQKLCYNAKNRHTFTPPNRRYLYQDIILTSRVGTKKPSIAFSIDTSGSMSPKDIEAGISELDAIRKLYKVPVYFMECDYNIHRAGWVSPYEPIPKVVGGGGTSFVPVMEHLRNKKIDVDALVFFTDGYGEFGNAPDFDVIWAINSTVNAPYGKTIRVA
jgi:predicted metal-dependent peptidase